MRSYLYADIAEFFRERVPSYTSFNYKENCFEIADISKLGEYVEAIRWVSQTRSHNRVHNYVDELEVLRVRDLLAKGKRDVSIRFGVEKKGNGYHGERGDFCLVGGTITGSYLTLFYRSLELIGGFGYDLCIIDALERGIGIKFKRLRIITNKAYVFALKGNSNQTLYPKLQKILV